MENQIIRLEALPVLKNYIYGDNEIDQESYNQLKMMTDEIYVNQFPFDPLKIKKLV